MFYSNVYNQVVIDGALQSDMLYNGDLSIVTGGIDLNGHNLTVNGSLNHQFGDLEINGGTLTVTGTYLLYDAARLYISNDSDLNAITIQQGYKFFGNNSIVYTNPAFSSFNAYVIGTHTALNGPGLGYWQPASPDVVSGTFVHTIFSENGYVFVEYPVFNANGTYLENRRGYVPSSSIKITVPENEYAVTTGRTAESGTVYSLPSTNSFVVGEFTGETNVVILDEVEISNTEDVTNSNEETERYFYIEYTDSGVLKRGYALRSTIPVVADAIDFVQDEVSLYIGHTFTLQPLISPGGVLCKDVIWKIDGDDNAVIFDNGHITAVAEGEVTITATLKVTTSDKTNVNEKSCSCRVQVKRILTYPDNLIKDSDIQESILKIETIKDQAERAYLRGDINVDIRERIVDEMNYRRDLFRAEYILIDNNPHSNFAYEVLGGRMTLSNASPLPNPIYFDKNNKDYGLEIIVIQKALELYGYYENNTSKRYGYYDAQTYNAILSVDDLISFDTDNREVFDSRSYNVLFNDANKSLRTNDAIRMLRFYSAEHALVQKFCKETLLLSGVYADIEVPLVGSAKSGREDTYGRIDIVADAMGGSYIWEVKHKSKNAINNGSVQLQRYVATSQFLEIEKDDPYFGIKEGKFSLPLKPGLRIFDGYIIAGPTGGYIKISQTSYLEPDAYKKAVIMYEEKNSLDEGERVSVPVPIEIREKETENSFNFESGIRQVVNYAGQTLETIGVYVDENSKEIFVLCAVGFMVIALPLAFLVVA